MCGEPVLLVDVPALEGLSEADRMALPIEACSDFQPRLPYDLDDPCIRLSEDGMWHLMHRIRKGWGETASLYESLNALLQQEQVAITGQYADATGQCFTVVPAALTTSVTHDNRPERFMLMMAVPILNNSLAACIIPTAL